MEQVKYSKITLKPEDKEEQEGFRQFRNDDVTETYTFVCGLGVFGTTLSILSFLAARDRDTWIQMFGGLILLTFYMSIWFLGRRFKSIATQLIAVQYLLLQGFTAIYFSQASLEGMVARIAVQYGIYTLLMAPSLGYACFYLAVFYLNISQVVYRTDERHAKMNLIFLGAGASVFAVVFYYIY